MTPSLIQPAALTANQQRVTFNLCSLMHQIHIGRGPAYLQDIVTAAAARTTKFALRSADTTDYVLPRLPMKLSERAFSYAGPAAWNSIPADIRQETSTAKFRKMLKTHLFSSAFRCFLIRVSLLHALFCMHFSVMRRRSVCSRRNASVLFTITITKQK
jgi:hypothetical protein